MFWRENKNRAFIGILSFLCLIGSLIYFMLTEQLF